MKKIVLLSILLAVITLNCTEEEEPLICYLYGWVKRETDSTGVNDLLLRIRDINPNDVNQWRERNTTTRTEDSIPGFFEMDSVCYGTSKMQGIGYVTIIVDNDSNPGWTTQYWQPNVYGAIDTVILYIKE